MSETTSPELSKQLKEAGAKQELQYGDKFWSRDVNDKWGLCTYVGGDTSVIQHWAKSFNCDELWNRLPGTLEEPTSYWNLEVGKGRLGTSAGYVKEYWQDAGRQKPDSSQLRGMQLEETIVEALGKLYLWCLQNGHCDE